MICYSELGVPESLRAYVRSIWRLQGLGAEAPEPILPDGCAELVINLGDAMVHHRREGASLQPATMIVGQMTSALTLQPVGTVDAWGARFHPWAIGAFLHLSALELRDLTSDADAVESRLGTIRQCLIDVGSDAERYRRLVEILQRLLSRAHAIDARIPKVVATVGSMRHDGSIAGAAKALGMSVRGIQRIFHNDVGLSPKQFVRIHRFQRALALRRSNGELTWGSIAARVGYFDQAHLIHDSLAIANRLPRALASEAGDLTAAFLDDEA